MLKLSNVVFHLKITHYLQYMFEHCNKKNIITDILMEKTNWLLMLRTNNMQQIVKLVYEIFVIIKVVCSCSGNWDLKFLKYIVGILLLIFTNDTMLILLNMLLLQLIVHLLSKTFNS